MKKDEEKTINKQPRWDPENTQKIKEKEQSTFSLLGVSVVSTVSTWWTWFYTRMEKCFSNFQRLHFPSPKAAVVSKKWLPLFPRIFDNLWRHYWTSQLGGATGTLWVQAREAAKHPQSTGYILAKMGWPIMLMVAMLRNFAVDHAEYSWS